jgi:excisionase family DNA binding protein
MLDRADKTPATELPQAGDPPTGDGRRPALLPLLLTRAQVAVLTALSERTIKRMTAESGLPGIVHIGRSVRYSRRAVEQWVERGCPQLGAGRRRGRASAGRT